MDQLRQSKFFSKIDLRSGYHQMKIRPEGIHKTAFVTRYGQYEYTVVSFGLTNTPAYFMNMMNKVFMDELDKCVIVFIEDILVFSKTAKEHEEHLRIMLGKLRQHQLYAKFNKCEFWMEEVTFVGHVLSAKGVSIHPSKIEAVSKWQSPKSVIEIRSFLGLAGYYRRFIENFSKIAKPMTELLKSNTPYMWSDKCCESQLSGARDPPHHYASPNSSRCEQGLRGVLRRIEAGTRMCTNAGRQSSCICIATASEA
jgi:hypothetical protein